MPYFELSSSKLSWKFKDQSQKPRNYFITCFREFNKKCLIIVVKFYKFTNPYSLSLLIDLKPPPSLKYFQNRWLWEKQNEKFLTVKIDLSREKIAKIISGWSFRFSCDKIKKIIQKNFRPDFLPFNFFKMF